MPIERPQFESEPNEMEATPESPESKKMTRRQFLQGAGALGALGALAVGGHILEETAGIMKTKEAQDLTFSWPKIREEIDKIKREDLSGWETEVRARIKSGVEKYINELVQDNLKKKYDKGSVPKGSVEGAAAGAVKDQLDKIFSPETDPSKLDRLNQILLFGGAGAGIGYILKKVEAFRLIKNPDQMLQRLKKHVEDTAYSALSLGEPETVSTGGSRGDFEYSDDVAQVIYKNIVDNPRLVMRDLKTKNMLEQWGAGTMLTIAPFPEIVSERSKTLGVSISKSS